MNRLGFLRLGCFRLWFGKGFDCVILGSNVRRFFANHPEASQISNCCCSCRFSVLSRRKVARGGGRKERLRIWLDCGFYSVHIPAFLLSSVFYPDGGDGGHDFARRQGRSTNVSASSSSARRHCSVPLPN